VAPAAVSGRLARTALCSRRFVSLAVTLHGGARTSHSVRMFLDMLVNSDQTREEVGRCRVEPPGRERKSGRDAATPAMAAICRRPRATVQNLAARAKIVAIHPGGGHFTLYDQVGVCGNARGGGGGARALAASRRLHRAGPITGSGGEAPGPKAGLLGRPARFSGNWLGGRSVPPGPFPLPCRGFRSSSGVGRSNQSAAG